MKTLAATAVTRNPASKRSILPDVQPVPCAAKFAVIAALDGVGWQQQEFAAAQTLML
ncbi:MULTISPECIES: hypothetical protein [unclassified Cupriavidus]|uniref:hypothetical protein n=1 Tax=unclassified Cupriavidus TaxID=2640874 RepID=UPI001AE946A6|nr:MULTISPECIES: hypothetical protein [unclassified Cupriavidus]MBP0633589.1 hypothetical protein [Cupriavidus sp. AcVe19-1a]MBP0639625.1 hypothetical protein [Cupriavidus sp. AcVe19-6a]